MCANTDSDDAEQQTNDITVMYELMGDLQATMTQFDDIVTKHVKGGGTNRSSSMYGIDGFEDGWFTADDDDGLVLREVRTYDADAPAWKFQQVVDDLEAMGADVDIDLRKTAPGAPPKINDAGNVIPQGTSIEATPSYFKVEATLDVTDQMNGGGN